MLSRRDKGLAALTLGALGVVFGDIGTSPLYALHAIFGPYGLQLPATRTNILGILSLIFWSVTLVVTVKYISFVMRADNRGEGGILALVALLKKQPSSLYIVLGLAGVALFYGDSLITPAISTLSAVEGLNVAAPGLSRLVIPLVLILLAGLFWIQRFGTGAIGRLFGAVMLIWFCVIGFAGAAAISQQPQVLQALSPLSIGPFVRAQPLLSLLALGTVVLAITGAEALYADMGHFGRQPIRRAWLLIVFPALTLCYLGQGALLLARSDARANPFMALFPPGLQLPAVILATAATLIASQSVISGAFSLTRQAVQLDFLPRLLIRHTSDREAGQIYVPLANLVMFVGVVTLVLAFQSSGRLAGVYGIAVSGTLLIDSLLFLAVTHFVWRKPAMYTAGLAILFVTVDTLFVTGNLPKVVQGGWLPLGLSLLAFVVLHTWYRGQSIVSSERQAMEGPLQDYIDEIRRKHLVRVPGNAVYIGHHAGLAPLALHAAVEKLQELHQKVVIVTVKISTDAHVAEKKRAVFNDLGYNDGISQLRLTYGYHDHPNIPHALQAARKLSPELDFDPAAAAYFVSLSHIVPSKRHNLASWRKFLYVLMSRNATSTSDYYKLPIERTVEMRSLISL